MQTNIVVIQCSTLHLKTKKLNSVIFMVSLRNAQKMCSRSKRLFNFVFRPIIDGYIYFYSSTVPSKPPDNITAYSTSPTSIVLTWSPITEKDAMGKLLGYLVQYKEAWTLESYINISLRATAASAVIKGLNVLKLYRIQIAGFTSAGVGVQSRPQYAKTGTN